MKGNVAHSSTDFIYIVCSKIVNAIFSFYTQTIVLSGLVILLSTCIVVIQCNSARDDPGADGCLEPLSTNTAVLVRSLLAGGRRFMALSMAVRFVVITNGQWARHTFAVGGFHTIFIPQANVTMAG